MLIGWGTATPSARRAHGSAWRSASPRRIKPSYFRKSGTHSRWLALQMRASYHFKAFSWPASSAGRRHTTALDFALSWINFRCIRRRCISSDAIVAVTRLERIDSLHALLSFFKSAKPCFSYSSARVAMMTFSTSYCRRVNDFRVIVCLLCLFISRAMAFGSITLLEPPLSASTAGRRHVAAVIEP